MRSHKLDNGLVEYYDENLDFCGYYECPHCKQTNKCQYNIQHSIGCIWNTIIHREEERDVCSDAMLRRKELDRLNKIEKQYNELIYEVCEKFPNETRHETALRYIREREHKPTLGEVCNGILKQEEKEKI